jgi:hypothetical protein
MKKLNVLQLLTGAMPLFLTLSCIEDAPSDFACPAEGQDSPNSLYRLVVSAGKGGSDDHATRATLDLTDYTYSWDEGEQIKLSVTTVRTRTPISTELDRLTLTSNNTARSTHANFVGLSSTTRYEVLQSAPTFNYYAYYGNGYTVTDADFPNTITFELASSYTGISVADFTAAKTPMVGAVEDQVPNILYDTQGSIETTLAENIASGGIHFDFDHITSYAAIEFDLDDISPKGMIIQSFTMTVTGGTAAENMICGSYTYDMATGTGALSGGTNNITITNIAGMISGQRLYIPMPVKKLTGFRFDYTLTGARVGHVENATTSMTFERGKIHHIRITPKDIASIGDSHLLYFDTNDPDHPLKVGSWLIEDGDPNTETLDETDRSNMAFFKFGSVVGFLVDGTWNNANSSNIVKFNPTSTSSYTNYANVPLYETSDYNNNNILNVSDDAYHNADNIWRNGKGDPCRLSGINLTEFKRLTGDSAREDFLRNNDSGWRLPTNDENIMYIGLDPTVTDDKAVQNSGNGYYQWDGDTNTGVFLRNPAGNAQLPASGRRNTNGNTDNSGIYGNYWSSTPVYTGNNAGARAYNFGFEDDSVTPNSPSSQFGYGMAIRCVRK